jgi:hypothetical protein
VAQQAVACAAAKFRIDQDGGLDPSSLGKPSRRRERRLLRSQWLKQGKQSPCVRIVKATLKLANVDQLALVIAGEIKAIKLPFFSAHPATANVSRWRHVALNHS